MIETAMRWLARVCHVGPGEFRRLLPFFALYAVLFSGMTLADGIALALFVSRVGAESLPLCYGATAFLTMGAVAVYARVAPRRPATPVFRTILIGIAVPFTVVGGLMMAFPTDRLGPAAPGALFVARELGMVLLLAHFGTFVQNYFTRDELNRVLAIVYAGGRLGGLVGGGVLARLAPEIGVAALGPVVGLIMLAGAVVIGRLDRIPHPEEPGDGPSPPTAPVPGGGGTSGLLVMPLFRWFIASSVVFMVVRWFLNYQYNAYFEAHFATEEELAAFLGRYAQVALLLSLVIQVVVVNRMVARLGIRGAHLVTVLMLLSALVRGLWPMSLAAAVWARMVESELRFGLRNPVNQIVTNQFSKPDRIRVRAWSMGLLSPIAALIGSAILVGLLAIGLAGWIPAVGLGLGLVYLATALGLYRWILEPRNSTDQRPEPHPDRAGAADEAAEEDDEPLIADARPPRSEPQPVAGP